MAKSVKNSEVEEITIPEVTVVEPVEDNEKDSDTDDTVEEKASVSKVAVQPATTRKVKIHTTEPVDSIIAGVPLILRKDKDHEVDSHVAAILVKGKKAYRI